jgi:hypothetical protein
LVVREEIAPHVGLQGVTKISQLDQILFTQEQVSSSQITVHPMYALHVRHPTGSVTQQFHTLLQ